MTQTIFQKLVANSHWTESAKSTLPVMSLENMWVYIVGPMIGAVLAGLLNHCTRYNIAQLEESALKHATSIVQDDAADQSLVVTDAY